MRHILKEETKITIAISGRIPEKDMDNFITICEGRVIDFQTRVRKEGKDFNWGLYTTRERVH